VTLLVPAMTPAESGAIGAACEVPGTAAIAKAATAIAKKMVRIIVVLLRREPREHKTRKHDGGSAMSVFRPHGVMPAAILDRISRQKRSLTHFTVRLTAKRLVVLRCKMTRLAQSGHAGRATARQLLGAKRPIFLQFF
jgi:hypothetical protein